MSVQILITVKAMLKGKMNSILSVRNVEHSYGSRIGCRNISFDLWPGEVLGIVGESGSGKTTLLNLISGRIPIRKGDVIYTDAENKKYNMRKISETEKRRLLRTEFGFVHQHPKDGLRLGVSAGGNIGERLMAGGWRNFHKIRSEGTNWLEKVEIDSDRIDNTPITYSGGMQQRLQIARNLVSNPRLVFMDEPTGGLDVSVQARLLDLIRNLVQSIGLAVALVTHDLAIVRLLTQRLIVMQAGEIVEAGLTDQTLDDPQHSYTQLLVSSILQV